MELERLIQEGGWAMVPLFILGCTAMPATLAAMLVGVASTKKRERALMVSLGLMALGLLILAVGGIGYSMAMMKVTEAIAGVDPSDRDMLRIMGRSEARAPLVLALWMCLMPLAGGVALLGLGVVRLPRYGAR